MNFTLPANFQPSINRARRLRVERLQQFFNGADKTKPFRLMAESPARMRLDVCLASFDSETELRAALERAELSFPDSRGIDLYLEYPVNHQHC